MYQLNRYTNKLKVGTQVERIQKKVKCVGNINLTWFIVFNFFK